jgi:hypothetical protein
VEFGEGYEAVGHGGSSGHSSQIVGPNASHRIAARAGDAQEPSQQISPSVQPTHLQQSQLSSPTQYQPFVPFEPSGGRSQSQSGFSP